MSPDEEGWSVQERNGQPLQWYPTEAEAIRAELKAARRGVDATSTPHPMPPSPVLRQPAARRKPDLPPSLGPAPS